MLWINRSLIDQSKKASIAGPCTTLAQELTTEATTTVTTDFPTTPTPCCLEASPPQNNKRKDATKNALQITISISELEMRLPVRFVMSYLKV